MPTYSQTKVKRYFLFAGDEESAPGWGTFIMDSNYPTSLSMYVPDECSWYQIVDMTTKEVVVFREIGKVSDE